MRFADRYSQWLGVRGPMLAPSTLADYEAIARIHLLPSLGSMRVSRIKASHVEAAINSATPGRRKNVRALARLLLPDVQVDLNLRPPDSRKVPNACTVDQLATGWWRPLVLTAAYSGLRWGELAALRASDVDLDARTIRVERSYCKVIEADKEPKSRSSRRVVAYMPECHEAISTVLIPGDALMFTMREGHRLRSSNFHKYHWQPRCRELGVEFTFHDLRHFAATTYLNRGVPVHLVAAMLGHSSPATTLSIYAGYMEAPALTVAGLLRLP